MKGKYLITTDAWFLASDGRHYRAVYGECTVLSTKEALGFDPNRNSANWFVRVGSEDDHVIIAGCQIHYAQRTDKLPNTGLIREKSQSTDPEDAWRDGIILIVGEEANKGQRLSDLREEILEPVDLSAPCPVKNTDISYQKGVILLWRRDRDDPKDLEYHIKREAQRAYKITSDSRASLADMLINIKNIDSCEITVESESIVSINVIIYCQSHKFLVWRA